MSLTIDVYRGISTDSLIAGSEWLMRLKKVGSIGLTDDEKKQLELSCQVLRERNWFTVNDVNGYPVWRHSYGNGSCISVDESTS
jgi:hypothetical protein